MDGKVSLAIKGTQSLAEVPFKAQSLNPKPSRDLLSSLVRSLECVNGLQVVS